MLREESLPGNDGLQQGHLGVVRPDEDGAGYERGKRLGAGNGGYLVGNPVDGFAGEAGGVQLAEICVT